MTAKLAGLAFALALVSVPALAQAPGRYALVPAGDGFLRLDTQSGVVSRCGPKPDGWACERLSDDAQPGEAASIGNQDLEIGELRDRLAKTEADLAATKAQNAELAARTETAEKSETAAKAEAAERVAKAEEAAREAAKDAHGVEPHAVAPVTPEQAVDSFSEFVTRLMRRLQEMARELERDEPERAL